MKKHSLFLITKPLEHITLPTISLSVTCVHTANSCDEGRINIAFQPCRRSQLKNAQRHLGALKEVRIKLAV